MISHMLDRKLPLVSPTQLRKGFEWAYKRRGLHLRGAYNRNKNPVPNRAMAVLVDISLFISWFLRFSRL